MKKLLLPALLLILAAGCAKKYEVEESASPLTIDIIPRPASATVENKNVLLGDALTILASSDDEKSAATLIQEFLRSKKINAVILEVSKDKNVIRLTTVQNDSLGSEGYKLTTNADGINLEAGGSAGLFYGVQSLIQLISDDGKSIPVSTIVDHPRFAYRGLHLDVCRHMFPAEFVKKYIDLMSHYKFNTFHWHLTEDQGWRIEIKKYPKLQEVAAYRNETLIGHAGPNNTQYDGKRYGGYYTQDEIREIVDYAAKRHITIIPEIEMPGHALAALSAYPSLGCTGGPYTAATTWGVFDDVFCAGKDSTFIFLQGVIDEVVDLFPSKYIHVGGDESPKTRWKKCPNCQKRIKDEKLKDEHELQSYFVQRMEKYINAKGRSIIGWDEILEGGLAPNATVMSWRGEEGGVAAAKQQHNVIMTPGNWCYLDHYQADEKTEPLAIGGLTTVEEVYSYEPLPKELTAEEQKYILGAQGNLWTEYIPTPEQAEYMVYPRAIALSEVVWSPQEGKDFNNFTTRLKANRHLLDEWHVNYAKHIFNEAK